MNIQQQLQQLFLFPLLLLSACTGRPSNDSDTREQSTATMDYTKGTFGYDLTFLQRYHNDLIVLHNPSHTAQLIVLPAYQGRVMTTTAAGHTGSSFGWINYDLIASGNSAPHMNAFGGEERFWLGPEGGQFSIYFKKGVPFTFDNWQVPKEIDTEAFRLLDSSPQEARFEKEMHLENYSGHPFDLRVNRNVRLLDDVAIEGLLDVVLPDELEVVAFETENILTNIGTDAWTKDTGMLSVWILSMLNASEHTTVAVPFADGEESRLGHVVTDNYFGKVPPDRLAIKNGLILFKADGKYRSKIGVAPARATPLVASYNATDSVLTLATFSLPKGATDYVNSLWELQDNPFGGDAINAYNDGPVNGGQMGNLYEIESSSPAAALKPGQSLSHFHRTIHLKGSAAALNGVSKKLLGVAVESIKL